MAVADRVRAERRALKWTQQELAEVSGVSRATIARIEAGTHAPTLATLRKLAEVMGLRVADLTD